MNGSIVNFISVGTFGQFTRLVLVIYADGFDGQACILGDHLRHRNELQSISCFVTIKPVFLPLSSPPDKAFSGEGLDQFINRFDSVAFTRRFGGKIAMVAMTGFAPMSMPRSSGSYYFLRLLAGFQDLGNGRDTDFVDIRYD
jgi:hypothetical protein